MDFSQIDIAINKFTEGKTISVSKDSHSDWLSFEWRQLTWSKDDIERLMEIHPNFDKAENIESWNFYAAASYDEEDKRYYISKRLASKKTLEFISDNIESLLAEGYDYATCLRKNEIPFAVQTEL